MSSHQMGWRGYLECRVPIIRQIGVPRVGAILVLATLVHATLEQHSLDLVVLAMALAAMIAWLFAAAARVEGHPDDPRDDRARERRLYERAARCALLLWIVFACAAPGWLKDQLLNLSVLVTVSLFIVGDRLPAVVDEFTDTGDSWKTSTFRAVRREATKALARGICTYGATLAVCVAVSIPSIVGDSLQLVDSFTFLLTFNALSVIYQLLTVGLFSRSVFHRFFSERVLVDGTDASPGWMRSVLRALTFNIPMSITWILVSVDRFEAGMSPALDVTLEILYTLSLFFYGIAYLHRDHRGIHDILAGTVVVREQTS